MKRIIHTISLITITLFGIQNAQAGEMRVWKSSKGTQIQAELLFMGETLVVLKTEKGKEISIPITSLGAESMDYIKQLREEKIADKESKEESEQPVTVDKAASAEDKKDEPKMVDENFAPEEGIVAVGDGLDTLSEGAGKGLHAYYEGKKYIAELNNNGSLYVFYKDSAGKADRRWKILVRAKSILKTKNGWKEFEFEKILKSSPAKKDAAEIKFTFQSATDIKSEVIFEFEPDGFTTWTRSDPGSSTPEGTLHAMSHQIFNMHQVSKEKSYLKQIELKRELVRGEKEKFDFNESVNIHGDTQETEITGPIFDKTKIILERGRDQEAKFTPAQYPGAPLSDGFSMNCIKTDCTTKKHNSEKTTVTFK